MVRMKFPDEKVHRVSYDDDHYKIIFCRRHNSRRCGNWEVTFNNKEVTCKNCLKIMEKK